MSYLVVGLVSNFDLARSVSSRLRDERVQNVIVLAEEPDDGKGDHFHGLQYVADSPAGHTASAALKGASVGALVSAATIVTPFIGPFIFGLTAPAAVATGALIGAAVGASEPHGKQHGVDLEARLMDLGLPHYEIPRFEKAVDLGYYMLAVTCPDQAEMRRIENLLESLGAENVGDFVS